jgi:hypothetical protein
MRGSSVRSRRCCRTCLRLPSYARERCGGCARACRGRRWRRACRVRCTSGDAGSRGGACGSLMAIGAIPGKEKNGSKMHVVMVAARLLLLLRNPHFSLLYVCAWFVRMWFVADPSCGVFAFSAVLPSQLPVCGGSFDELTVMFCAFFNFRSALYSRYSMLLDKDNFTDWLSRRFPPLLRLYSFGIQETYIRDF